MSAGYGARGRRRIATESCPESGQKKGVFAVYQFRRCIQVIDSHTAGEPLRIVTSGLPPIKGATMLEKKAYAEEHLDGLRKLLMLEPRGHKDMFGAILVSPVTDDGDLGVLFTHNEGQSTMCGHGIIAVTKVALETGMLPAAEGENLVRIDAPAGRITAFADVEGGRVREVSFRNVPSFVLEERLTIDHPELGTVEAALVYGGAFYVIVEEEKLGLKVEPRQVDALVRRAMELKRLVMADRSVVHPDDPRICGVYGTIVTSPLERIEGTWRSRNVCVFAEGSVDRSPCGTGTSARMALLERRGQMTEGDELVNVSIIGTAFRGRIEGFESVAGRRAIIPRVGGQACIMGFSQLVLDPADPLPEGFRL